VQDFNKSVLSSLPARVTQKTVDQQQAQVNEILDAIIDDARNFYKLVAA
jgi:hypothetical protein